MDFDKCDFHHHEIATVAMNADAAWKMTKWKRYTEKEWDGICSPEKSYETQFTYTPKRQYVIIARSNSFDKLKNGHETRSCWFCHTQMTKQQRAKQISYTAQKNEIIEFYRISIARIAFIRILWLYVFSVVIGIHINVWLLRKNEIPFDFNANFFRVCVYERSVSCCRCVNVSCVMRMCRHADGIDTVFGCVDYSNRSVAVRLPHRRYDFAHNQT